MNLFSYYNEKISDGAWDSTFFVIPSKNLRIYNETKIKFDNNEKERKWIYSLIIIKKYPTVRETPLFFVIPIKNNHETVIIGEKVKDFYRSNEF